MTFVLWERTAQHLCCHPERGRPAAESKDPLKLESIEYGTVSDFGGSLDSDRVLTRDDSALQSLVMTVSFGRSG